MKSSNSTLLIASILFLSFGISNPSLAGVNKSSHFSLTVFRLTPKQFSKGWLAEKRDYATTKSSSTKKMLKKRHGSWIQRWFSKNH